MYITPLELRLYDLLPKTIEVLGYNLVRIKIINNDDKTLQIMIDKDGETAVSAADCEKVSKNISPILDVEDLIKDKYNLEISSPGIDRPLVFLKDFLAFKGKKVKMKTRIKYSGSVNHTGFISGIEDNQIFIANNNNGNTKNNSLENVISINYNDILNANIVGEI